MTESVLKIARLAGSSNWDIWNIRMQAVLTEKGYYDVMTQPMNDTDPSRFRELQLKALAFIRLALADGPLLQTRNIDNPMTLWSTLQQLYEPKGFSAEFLTCKTYSKPHWPNPVTLRVILTLFGNLRMIYRPEDSLYLIR